MKLWLLIVIVGGALLLVEAPPAHSVVHGETIVGETHAEHVAAFHRQHTPVYCPDSVMTFEGGYYAIPCRFVNAESGGYGGPERYCNIYGLIGGLDEPYASSRTWILYGGLQFAPTACAATDQQQSVVARRLWRDRHAAAWEPFE